MCSAAWFSVDSRCSQVSIQGWSSQYNTQFCLGRVWASLKPRRPACITDDQTPVPSSVATAGPFSHCLLSQSQLSPCAVHDPQFSRGPGLCQDQEHLLHRDWGFRGLQLIQGLLGSSLEGEGKLIHEQGGVHPRALGSKASMHRTLPDCALGTCSWAV